MVKPVGASTTSDQHKQVIASVSTTEKMSATNELDSHADTTVAGSNMVMLEDTGGRASVTPFSKEYSPVPDIPIATCATTYICTSTGKPYLLVFGEALYFGGRMESSLICPNQD